MPKNQLLAIRKSLTYIINHHFTYKTFNVPVDEKTFETIEEMNIFLSYIRNPKYLVFFKVMAWTGVRKGEAIRIKKEDFDFENEDLYVRITKNAKEAEELRVRVPLPSKLCNELKLLFSYGVLKENPFCDCTHESKKIFRLACEESGKKYNQSYGTAKDGRTLYFFNIGCFRKFFQSMIANNSDLIGRALHNTPTVAKKHYLSKISRIRKIINELYM
ncbi:MAG: tyrosine-type recombinase/integrase [Nanoarchaeota archaeon]|nr:tyrosine-type recombinase/integrase [Nanoarchaeota archaeon]